MNSLTTPKFDMRDVMISSFQDAVDRGINLAAIVSDSTSTAKITPFQKRNPDRVINVGIAEQTLVGAAVGMSLGGYVAVTANAAPFLVSRSNEQIKNDVCYSNTNVKLVGLNAGVCYGALGATHHAIDDISIMRGFGNIEIFAPSDADEAAQIFKYAYDHVGPVYIRLDSASFPNLHGASYEFEPGSPDEIVGGTDIAIVALGSVVHEAVAAAKALQAQSISASVISLSSIRPINKQKLIELLSAYDSIVTVEEHSIHGAIGSLVAELIAENGLSLKLTRLGLPEGEFSKTGPRAEIRQYYKIDAEGISGSIRSLR